jgi:hypothetical protein
MARALHRRGVLTKLRQSAAQDVEGGCGQLRARSLSPAPIRWVAKRVKCTAFSRARHEAQPITAVAVFATATPAS